MCTEVSFKTAKGITERTLWATCIALIFSLINPENGTLILFPKIFVLLENILTCYRVHY